MGSSEWEGLLERRLAVLPGSRDPGGSPILIVPLPQDPNIHDVGGISATVKYLKTIPSVGSRDRGWVVVVDARLCPYRLVKPTVSTLRATLGHIRHLFVVRPEGFWDKQRVDCRKSEVDNQPIYVSVGKLPRYLETSQLPVDLGGSLDYDHGAWLKTRKAYEEFVDESERSRRDLESLQAELRREEPCSRASTLHDLLQVNTNTYTAITQRPHHVFDMGRDVLKVLEMDEESGFRVCEGHGDAAEAASRVRSMLEDLHLLSTAVEACWRRLNTALDMHHQFRDLETAMTDIGSWLVSAGQTLLNETRIGSTTEQAEALLREHEAIELKCRETYGRWGSLQYRIKDILERGEGDLRSLADHRTTTSDLVSLKEYTQTLVRTFASRLDRRRTLILASVRFHRITQQISERCEVLLQRNRWMSQPDDVDALKKTHRELTARKEAIDYLASEGTRSGEKLLDLLTVGVKDLSGRDVTPDYSNELNHVHSLLTFTHQQYGQAARQAELHKLRMHQNIQLLTCHRDVKQANKWLKALLEALVKAHSHIGRSSEEIRRLKTEHQHFQDTASGTFEYGYESARAALLVERAAGNNIALPESRRMVISLENIWKLFVQGSQEQLTRLRVAGVFFRTMEQHLDRLDTLCNTVMDRLGGRGLSKDGEGRTLLSARDRLLREIGRNVRLGKLLKERLLDPLVPNFNTREHNDNLLAQEAISERIAYITQRAQQLDTIMFPHQTINTTSVPYPTSPTPPDEPPPPPPPPLSPTARHDDHETCSVGSTEYWTCSECTCSTSGTYYTCTDCQDLLELFKHDDTRPPSMEDDLPLDDILKNMAHSRSRTRSRSLSEGKDEKVHVLHRRSRSKSKEHKNKKGQTNVIPDYITQKNGSIPIPVTVTTKEKEDSQIPLRAGWQDISQQKVTTRLVLQSGDGSGAGDQTFTLEHTTSISQPDEQGLYTPREAIREVSEEVATAATSSSFPSPPLPPQPQAFLDNAQEELEINTQVSSSVAAEKPEVSNVDVQAIRGALQGSAPSEDFPIFQDAHGDEDQLLDNMRKSAEWLELRVVELAPGMCVLGSTLEETQALQQAHEEVLSKLQSKQSPVEDLLNQADQLISTQRPRAEVYAAMAESLGLAWKNLNGQLDTRKQVLDMSLAFHMRARQYSEAMDAAERLYTDNVLPGDAETVRQLLAQLHDHKRTILEASMYTLQEAQQLLNRLKALATEGASLDSRPQHIRTNIDFACSQVEHYLESLHDRRRFLDGLFSARKHHLDECLALCILYQELTTSVTSLKKLRDDVSQHQSLGESQNNTEILLHEHLKREQAAKEQQDKCIHLLKTAEGMCSTGHYAGVEARARAYSVLEAATALHETCDTRTALLQQSILFFKLANTALTKFDQAEVQVATLTAEGSQRLSVVVGIVEEAVQPALTEGYAILEVTGGRNQPHNMGISEMIELLEKRRANLSSLCVSSTEQVLQRTELSNSFLEQYNSIESWLSRIGDAFLQGHQDPGGSLSLAKDFLHLHLTLNNDVMEKKHEIDALVKFLEQITPEINSEDVDSFHEKLKSLMDHWTSLKNLLDVRIQISEMYVKFHEDAEAVTNELEALELLLRDAKGEDRTAQIEAKWESVQKMYLDLTNTGKSFCQEAKNAQDPYLDVNRAVLCVETILEHLGKRRLVVTDLHSHYYQKITITKEMITMWKTYKENVTKMQKEMSGLETDFCPLLRGNTTNPELLVENLENRLSIYVQAVKKSQEDIQNMMTRAEVMSYKGDEGGQRDEVISSLLQLYQNLQNKATEYQILSHMLIQFLKNISEIHRSCNKLESQFGAIALDVGGVEGQMLEHEASRQAVLELLNYARKEADAIIKKIRDECPADSGSQDITIIEELLVRRGKTFEDAWTKRQQILEKQLKRSQYHVDLQVISDQLRDLSEQLGRMRGHYGDSLGAALNMQNSFQQFQATVDMLEKRIHTFTSTAIRMLGSDDHSGEIKGDLGELENKWSTFHMQVGQSKKSIEISIEFFRLAEEAEEWFKEGSKLLIAVAGESANVQSPEQAESLKSRIDVFLKPGKEKQEERIKKISSLAIQLYGDTAPRQVEMVTQQNLHMIESFTVINQNIVSITENLRIAEEQRKEQEKHNQELANKLSAAQVEAEVAKLATAAAEEARRAAEEVARNLAKPVEPIMPRMVEVNIQTEAIPMEEDKIKAPIRKESPPPKKVKLIDDEPQHMPPVFVNPLIGATVTEGIKFSFECKVVGFPMPNIEWFKDGMNMSTNPDYKTSMAEGLCKLTIEETFTEDTAKFTCRASNAAGIAETSANLIVKEAEPIEVLSPPVFMKRLVDSTALEGASYQLEATVQGNPLPVVSWAKDGTCVDESPDYVITYNNGDCVLRFEEVFLEDQAEYVCKATNDLGEDTTKAKLKVTAIEVSERPKMSMPLSNVMARAGQKFKLECHVTGTPTPTLTWFHNSKPIKETLDVKITFDGRVATLVTLEAFPKNAGTYTAVAKNTAGEAQTSCNVSVKGRIPTETSDSELASDIDVEPVKPSVHQALKDMSVKEGKSARLDCVIIGQPEPEVIWYHDDKPVKESTDFKLLFHGDRCSLVIQEAFLEDAGIYRVVAMNSAGEASTACFLNIEPSPELSPSVAAPDLPPAIAPRFSALLTDSHVTEGNSAALRAAVTGTPMPSIAWFREGIPLIPDEQLQITESPDGNLTVSIPFTTLDHTGQYEVVATNPAGTAKCVAYLSIETKLPTPPPPAPREPPTFTRLITDTQVVNGQSVVFEAEVSGRPVPTVHWTLNDDVITGQEYRHGVPMYKLKSEGNKHTFEITEVLKPIAGRVTIVAENITGRATSAAQLRVVDPPPVVQPVGTQTTEESHVTKTSTTSSSMERRTQFMETTHTTKVVTSSGGPDQTTKHSTSATQTSQMKKVDDEPVVQVHGTRMQDVTQKGEAPPVISNKVSIVKMKGDKIVKEAMSDSTMVTMPQPKSIMATMPQPTSTIVTMSQPETTIVTMSQPTSAIETMQQPKSAIVTMPQSIEPMKVIDAMKALNTTITAEPARVDLVKAYPVKPTTPTIVAGHIVPDESMQHVEPTKATEPMVSVKPTKPLEPAKVEEHMKITEPMDVNATIKKVTESEKRPAEPEKKAMPVKKRKTIPARFLQPLQGAIAHEDDKVTLECAVDGNPEPSVTWTKNGGPIPTDAATKKDMNRRSLFIPRVSQTHAGRYTCVVANEAGTAQSTCDLVVKKTQFPPVIGKRLQPLQVGCGERLHLEVDVTGTPPPTVIWTKDGQPIIPDDRVQVKHEGTRHYLVIQPATLSDVGRYGASATNSAGRAESLADVLVTTTVAPVIDKSPQHQRMFYSDVTDDARFHLGIQIKMMFTTRSEEKYEDRQCKEDHENTQKSSEYTREGRKPKFEEFKQTTQGTPGASSPYSEDTYYAMRDESDVTTEEGGRKRKKIEVKSETHVEVMSDKKVEVSESTNVDMSPNIKKKDSKSHKHEPKIELKDKKEDTNKVPVTSEATEDRKPKSEDFKRQTKGNSESEPFSKDSYYVKKDESNISTKSGRNIHKVEIKSETHVEVMTDKRFEVVKTTNVDLSPKTENRGISIEHKYQKLDGKSTSNQIPVKETKPVEVATTKSENLFSLPLPTPGSPPVEGIITQETSYVVDKVDVKSNLKPPQMVPVQTYLDEPFTVITETTDKTILDKKLEEQILIKEDRLETINTTEETTELTKSEPQIKVSEADSLKSTTLVKQAVVNQSLIDENKEKELDLKPFPFEPEPEVPKKPRGPPPPTPKKFVKGEFYESDYDSDYDGKFSQKWKVSEDEEAIYTKIGAPTGVEKRASLPHERTPTPPIKFEKPPKFDGPPRPKIEFPESEPEPEKEMSPEIIIPEKIEVIPEAVILKVQAKETKVFKSAAPKKEIKPQPPRVPSPVLQPEPPPEEGYAAPQPRKDPFANGIGVESTKITKIEDSSQFHRRFVTKVHTTRVIKFGENTRASETPPSREATPKYATQEIHKTEPMPDLEPFPFKVEPQKPRKERGPPPTAPKKFLRGEFSESDYESDFEGRIRPKWQPPDSDTEDITYEKVKIPDFKGRTPSKDRENTPTPPNVFDTSPPETGGPLRPALVPMESLTVREPSPEVFIPPEPVRKKIETPKKIPAKPKQETHKAKEPSPPLPAPGPTPEEGVIVKETCYVIDKVDLKTKIKEPKMTAIQTYQDEPYTIVTETTERTTVDKKLEEEMRIKNEILETKTITTTEYEQKQMPIIPVISPEVESKLLESFPKLEPFPFEPEPTRPKKNRGPPPTMPKKFIKGEFTESDYESDYEGRPKPKWKPTDSDAEDLVYQNIRASLPKDTKPSTEKERTPTPPTKFEIPQPVGGPLRPSLERFEPTDSGREPSPEIVIPKVEEKTKSPKVSTPKAPTIKKQQQVPSKPKLPSPVLPEPGPNPEYGYAKDTRIRNEEEKEDFHIRMIKKKMSEKTTYDIDIDITDIYDYISESEPDKTDSEIIPSKPFPKLEPFPYEPDPEKPKRERGGPPPRPKKFLKGEFRESDYDSDVDSHHIQPRWHPIDSEDEPSYRRVVAPPVEQISHQRSESSGRDPTPPTQFDQPPHFEGPPRPVAVDLPRRERRESLEEYSIPKFPKVEFKPFDLEDDETTSHKYGGITTDTETEPETNTRSPSKTGMDKKYAATAQKVVGQQFEDMTQTFRHKAQKFAEQLVTEVFAGKEGSEPTEIAGEPPVVPTELRSPVRDSDDEIEKPSIPTTMAEIITSSPQEPQAYRDEKRASEFGTAHLDPDSGLIYFKYDFGYEFGVILPGEGKKVEKRKDSNREETIPFPVIHIKPDGSQSITNGHVKEPTGSSSVDLNAYENNKVTKDPLLIEELDFEKISPQPSIHSEISEADLEYQQYMGNVIPEFTPKKQAQFRPISGEPYPESEGEQLEDSGRVMSPEKMATSKGDMAGLSSSTGVSGPKCFVPLVPGASVKPVAQQRPLDTQLHHQQVFPTRESGVSPGSPLTSPSPSSTPSTPRSGPLHHPTRPPTFITPLRDQTVLRGEAVRLECVVQADPPLQVTWSKDQQILQNGPDYQIVYRNGVCRLIIPHVFPDDDGTYTCTTVNLLGSDSTSAAICVTGEEK